jgi:hypothetical protein
VSHEVTPSSIVNPIPARESLFFHNVKGGFPGQFALELSIMPDDAAPKSFVRIMLIRYPSNCLLIIVRPAEPPMTRPSDPIVQVHPGFSPRPGIRRGWLLAVLLAPTCFLLGLAVAGGRPLVAQQESSAEPLFYKFGKTSISLSHISHVVDEPGYNMPPGSLQIYFGGGNQSWLALFGTDADAFRQAIAKVSVDMTPKGNAPAGATVPSKKAAPRRPLIAPPSAPAQQPVPAPQPAPAPPKQGTLFETP